MPKVSVVVPVYNVSAYLRECMDSLVRQTLREIEIICVNDGSTDNSPEILREYAAADSRVILIDQENGGYGKAMNAGIDRATGEYLGIVEPDDYVRLTMFEDLYRTAEENRLDLVKADYDRFTTGENGETRTFRRTHLSPRETDYGRVFRPTEEKESFFFVMNTWAGIYRLSFLKEHGIRHHETPGASFQDNGFWFQTFLYAERAMILNTP
jgi:glycosyltransferase involved in cell wall biosynthesis